MEPITKKILNFNQGYLPDMVNYKYSQMAASSYGFFRGSCHLFYEEFCKEKKIPFSPLTWICGDLHMENFGSYKANNRLVYFDLNDFDEAILAPASWELVHFVSSIFVAFETLNIESDKAMNLAKHYLKSYSKILSNGKSLYIEPKIASGIVKKFLKNVSKRKETDLLNKRTELVKHKRKLIVNSKLSRIDKNLKKELAAHIQSWIINNSTSPYNLEVKDIMFRRAGLGSLGLKRYVVLLKSTNVKEQYMLADMKQSRKSSLAAYLKIKQPQWASESDRIISIQKRMQNVEPALLSTTLFKGDHFVIQELQPTKDSISLELIKHDYRHLYNVIHDMALLTASSHLRSSGRQGSASADELISFGDNENWQDALLIYAVKYANMVQQNYRAFLKDYRSGITSVKKK